MAEFAYTSGESFDLTNSNMIYQDPIDVRARTLDFGPGISIENYTQYANQVVFVAAGPEMPDEFHFPPVAINDAGFYGNSSDFDYVTRVTGGNYGDVFQTGGGDDVLNGAGGNDVLSGGGGNDVLKGGDGSDVLNGDDGNDVLEGGRGNNVIDGGAGTNTLSYEHFDAPSSGGSYGMGIDMAGGVASDFTGSVVQDEFSNIANIRGSQYEDTIDGDEHNNVIEGGAGTDYMTGGDGIDTLSYEHSSEGVRIDLETGTAFGGDAAGDSLAGFENVLGSTSNDVLYGNGDANTLNGNGGNDELYGWYGDDRLVIGGSPVMVDGGEGMDLLFITKDSTVALTDASFTSLASIEKVYVRDGASLTMTGVDVGTKIFSQSVADGGATIVGTDLGDRIQAGKGDDVVTGGLGGDSLFGGAGADTFVFAAGDGRDVIRKFDVLNDKIDLSALAGDTNGLNVQSFHSGDSTLITLTHEGGPTDKIILLDVAFGTLTEGSFIL